MFDALETFHSPYLTNYMKAVEDTESPRLFHVWAAMSAVSAALARQVWLPFGMVGKVYGNQFILLVGPPAVRKSTAMRVAYRLVKESTNVRFAPTDTGGQRQGLIRALARGSEESEDVKAIEAALADPFSAQGTPIGAEAEGEGNPVFSCNKHTLTAYWSEFGGALGQGNHAMMDFLVQTYDGDDYTYEIKGGETSIPQTLMNVFACTTPASISTTLPVTADGHGFLSRFILVHGDENYKKVVWPSLPDGDLIMSLKATLAFINTSLQGACEISKAAKKHAESLYGIELGITDPRFAHYKSRRFMHLLKLSLALAASRKSLTIELDDITTAHTLLALTEKGMPDALGQFGMSPLSKVKQGILEYLRASGAPTTIAVIQAAFHRDARPGEVLEAVQDLMGAKSLVQTQSDSGLLFFSARRAKKDNHANDHMVEFLLKTGRT